MASVWDCSLLQMYAIEHNNNFIQHEALIYILVHVGQYERFLSCWPCRPEEAW
jgi:hypothetical protein